MDFVQVHKWDLHPWRGDFAWADAAELPHLQGTEWFVNLNIPHLKIVSLVGNLWVGNFDIQVYQYCPPLL